MIKEISNDKSDYLQIIRENNYLKGKMVECKINGNTEKPTFTENVLLVGAS